MSDDWLDKYVLTMDDKPFDIHIIMSHSRRLD